MEKEKTVTFTNVGSNDRLPYAKADLVKASRVGQNYSLSFYQMDYQSLALQLNNKSEHIDGEGVLISVGKIVLDKDTFLLLYKEINEIKQKAGI